MRLLIQRVKSASVSVNQEIVGKINNGLLIFVGVKEQINCQKMAEKVLNLRIFSDGNDKMNLSVKEIKGEILVVSQFTLYANCSDGNRPFFGNAAPPDIAKPVVENFINELKKSGLKVESGVFGAKMEVELINDGPVTIILE